MKQLYLCLLAAALVGCGATVSFSRVGDALPPKPAACEVAVLTAEPSGPYQELGTIDVQYKSQTAWINTASEFQKKVQPIVCNAGGDSVIARTNDYGVYLKGTVLSTKTVSAAPASTPAAAPAEASSETSGDAKQP